MHATDLKIARARLGVPGVVVSRLAGITRSRLSDIERGNVEPSPEERKRLTESIHTLTKAKEKVASFAAQVGWPF